MPLEPTPEIIFENRRHFLKLLSAASATGLSGLSLDALALDLFAKQTDPLAAQKNLQVIKNPTYSDLTPTEPKWSTSYTNFYEFSTDKQKVKELAGSLITDPWEVKITGLVEKPITLSIQKLMALAPLQERIYRFRCVEAWSMIVPWNGYPLAALIDHVKPKAQAKYIEFISLADPKQMPNLARGGLDFPYREGLRLDEARHDLTLLAFGMYGKTLTPQNGAPVRLVVPWKYGFKSSKSIVEIRFTDQMPATSWNQSASNEYGFYANVNPNVSHPRWSQANERVLGANFLQAKAKTLMFNGYPQVASLYKDMDLSKWF